MKHSRSLVLIEDLQIVGRATAEVGLPSLFAIPPSGDSSVTGMGGKCEHGVYIPAPDLTVGRALYCSICHPYEIIVREGALIKF